MLTAALFLPFAGALVVLVLPRRAVRGIRAVAVATTAATLGLAVALWATMSGHGFSHEAAVEWIPTLGVGYHVGVDGVSMPLVALTALLFVAAVVFSLGVTHRVKEYFVVFLFLETASLGVFMALDLFLFYVFWDLNLVAMYFVIAIWGHEGAERSALKFFLYTLAGSLAMLLAILGLVLAADPITFDMVELIDTQPLAGGGGLALLVWSGFALGFAIKTPTVPFHTWLPPAHADAPAAGSTVLAGVLLKMGTYAFIRISLEMLPHAFRRVAVPVIVVGVVGVLYGAFVALGQRDLKRLIAYTSVNHMGYVIMAIGAAAAVGGTSEARTLALNGATLQMVSHGLITGALFLVAGAVWDRAESFEIARFGGLADRAPLLTGVTVLAAFASLGLPGLSGFVAEIQIFVGTFGINRWAAGVALVGIVVTAALFLWTLQRLFLGDPGELAPRFETDLRPRELVSIGGLLVFVVAIGLWPPWIVETIDTGTRAVLRAIGG